LLLGYFFVIFNVNLALAAMQGGICVFFPLK